MAETTTPTSPTAKFEMNYKNKYYIDTTPTASDPTWAYLAPGITNVTPATNDVIDETPYMDGEGFSETDVTGIAPAFSLSGHRKVGDPAQDYIAAKQFGIGQDRRTNFKWVASDGRTLVWEATIVNPVTAGGDASAKQNFSAEIRTNGAPTSDSQA